MSVLDTVFTINTIVKLSLQLTTVDQLRDLERAWEIEDTLGPLVDPTAYRDRPEIVDRKMDVIRQYAKFRRSLEEYQDIFR